MQIETVGKYQLHLIAHEVPGGWDPYVSVYEFDDEVQDFRCVLEKHHASAQAIADYDDALEVARRTGNRFLETGKI
ncbi:MAG TPA: hypothetical protein VJ698_10720 [Noviherbaspirillum sp.]|uniref:hypothetical protein n=1 Tax=Noviherbaspirillum sp. TaxID=1926288 RepID=UPI002B48681A|nr:hypothetical protein [Noviherbaspirillum sp.]HJV85939.1 hypothetical protein [Noviherbaspirillum sp.]